MTFMFPPQCPAHAKHRFANVIDEPESDSDLSDSDNDMESTHAQAPTPRPSRIANGHGGYSRSHSRQRLSKDLRRTSESTFVSGNQILRQTQSYVVLDETRLPAVSPAHRKASLASSTGSAPQSPVQVQKAFQFPPVSNEPPTSRENGSHHSPLSPGDAYAAAALTNHLPNKKLNIDLKSLRMHLSARVTEVLACAETMWEWVQREKEKAKAREMAQNGDKDKTITERDWERAERRTSSLMEAEAQRKDVLALVRSDFDALLTRFEL
ncbi:hypothetical protein EWM64_g986 [Hericium alpestre]|uniref:Uncharacterized protein n=1 Tax=Hericium alpestre TaxID=135208 RepID=A0A4Z0A915_9AGAM|nr:hypothetical protein EWM64_g986 [Hericium alpestre]